MVPSASAIGGTATGSGRQTFSVSDGMVVILRSGAAS
jgi:hypothetical protein